MQLIDVFLVGKYDMGSDLNKKSGRISASADEVARLKHELEQQAMLIEAQNKKIAELALQKNEFLANVSHELRTPLTSIIGFTEIIMDDEETLLAENHRQMLEKVTNNSERLLSLINDLMDLAKIDAGKSPVKVSGVDLREVVAQSVATMEPMARENDLELVCELPSELPQIFTDDQKLSQILINLLSNAVKFTTNGRICASVDNLGDKVCIHIKDTGVGIARKDFKRIFDEFCQLEAAGSRKNGNGLGLAITKRLVRLLGGNIKVASNVGQGSTFTVTLPVKLTPTVSPHSLQSAA